MPWPESVTGKLREQIQVIARILGLLAEWNEVEFSRGVLQDHVDVSILPTREQLNIQTFRSILPV